MPAEKRSVSHSSAASGPSPPDVESPAPLLPSSPPPAPSRHATLLSHLHYLTWYDPPRPCQEWVQVKHTCEDRSVWVSSLSVDGGHRAATASDLVLDLVYVVLLAQLGRVFRTSLDSTGAWVAARDFFAICVRSLPGTGLPQNLPYPDPPPPPPDAHLVPVAGHSCLPEQVRG
jgi:hypothetical protein